MKLLFTCIAALLTLSAGNALAQADLSRLADHPRLLLPKGAEKKLLKQINRDAVWKEIHTATLGEADRIITLPVNERIKTGMRLLAVSRENLRRIFILSYAYRMTGQEKYLVRAEQEMLKAASFSDWNPSHFLDVGEMTMALGVGYDWLYPALSEASRRTIREAIVEKGFKPSYDTAYNWFVDAEHNWNQVCNGGLAFGAIAVAESEPEWAQKIIDRAIDKVRLPMRHYAPDGAYPEGPGYWGYGTLFNVLLIGGLESTFGTDYGLSQMPGFMQTGTYEMQMVSPLIKHFNYMDNSYKPESSSAPFWFYSKTQDPSVLCQQVSILQRDTAKKYLKDRVLPAMLIWGAGAPMEKAVAPQETFWAGRGNTPVCVMRSGWGDPNARFVGVKLGSPSINHGHMDVGSFVFEADGVRWAIDLGSEDYNTTETRGVDLWNMAQQSQRWDVFRYNNRSHNTLTFNDKLQRVNGSAQIIESDSATARRFVKTDLTPVYAGQVDKVERTISLVDNDYLLIEDEITAGKNYTRMRWTLMTRATPKILSDNTVMLEQDGKRCLLKIESETPIVWRFEKTPTVNTFDSPNPDVTMVVFDTDLKRGETQYVRAQLTPMSSLSRALEGKTGRIQTSGQTPGNNE
ncbi:heparinase [Alistipes indistinctus]|uniref:heparinase II/III domain-containing protein n=1 Tax=Alistipes indistinctus TaxID=626932 RepID=UPI000E498D2D|nr:heparinase II/III family protein [Alistipes indistinctus]RGU36694.1 heparinase [Alistipes indistinctus]